MIYSTHFFWFILWQSMIEFLLWFMRWSTWVEFIWWKNCSKVVGGYQEVSVIFFIWSFRRCRRGLGLFGFRQRVLPRGMGREGLMSAIPSSSWFHLFACFVDSVCLSVVLLLFCLFVVLILFFWSVVLILFVSLLCWFYFVRLLFAHP